MADIFTDNTITLTKGMTTEITLNTADKYVLGDIVVDVAPQVGSFNNQPTSGVTYTENTEDVTIISSDGYLYLNQGWFENTKISLNHLIGKKIHDLSMLDYKGSALKRRETANCYIVSDTGYYELPLVYGCGIVDGNINSASYTQVSGDNTQPFFNYLNRQINSPFIEEDTGVTAVSASVVFTDTIGFVIDDVYLTDGDLCKFLRFHVSSIPTLGGNATIAVKDESGQIMWSWHIWAYPFTLHTFTHTNASGNTYNILDVNLGWVKENVDSKKGTSPHYQWGRKDPMLRSGASVVGSFNITGCATSVAATIQNPNVFNLYERTNGNWWTNDGTPVNFYNYWDASQTKTGAADRQIVKTVYDPSPVGFHIPCGATFTGFSKSNGGTWDNGFTWDNNFFQAAGFRHHDENGVIYAVGDYGCYWSAASNSANYAYSIYFKSGAVNPQYGSNRADGFSVRPVARS